MFDSILFYFNYYPKIQKFLRILVTLKSKEHEKEIESWKGEREEHVIGYTVHVGGLENV